MDTLEGIEKLAKRAQLQKIPAFCVSDRVIAQLRFSKADTHNFVVFDFLAGLFAAAATVVFYVGINTWLSVMNPLTQFFIPLQEIRLW